MRYKNCLATAVVMGGMALTAFNQEAQAIPFVADVNPGNTTLGVDPDNSIVISPVEFSHSAGLLFVTDIGGVGGTRAITGPIEDTSLEIKKAGGGLLNADTVTLIPESFDGSSLPFQIEGTLDDGGLITFTGLFTNPFAPLTVDVSGGVNHIFQELSVLTGGTAIGVTEVTGDTEIPDPDPDPSTVPEPGTAALLGAGLLGAAHFARRSRRQQTAAPGAAPA